MGRKLRSLPPLPEDDWFSGLSSSHPHRTLSVGPGLPPCCSGAGQWKVFKSQGSQGGQGIQEGGWRRWGVGREKGQTWERKKKPDFLWQGFCDPWNVSPVGSDHNYSCSCFTSQLTEVWSHWSDPNPANSGSLDSGKRLTAPLWSPKEGLTWKQRKQSWGQVQAKEEEQTIRAVWSEMGAGGFMRMVRMEYSTTHMLPSVTIPDGDGREIQNWWRQSRAFTEKRKDEKRIVDLKGPAICHFGCWSIEMWRVLIEMCYSCKIHVLRCMPSRFSRVRLFATLWTVACRAPLSMGFPGKNTGAGCRALLQGIFLTQGSILHLLMAPALQADSLPLSHQGSPCEIHTRSQTLRIKNRMWNSSLIFF